MTIDERIEKLTESQEKTQTVLVGILDSIKRLESIALAHAVDMDDIDVRLTALEAKPRRKPQ
jgi:hypothetical protein